MDKKIRVVAQAFYGNRTVTDVHKNEIDNFILGHMDSPSVVEEKIDRTIVNIPNTDNIVIVYNKYQEEDELKRKEELLKEKNYELKPTVIIPENDIVLYSRCIVTRIDEHGELESLEANDMEKILDYLA